MIKERIIKLIEYKGVPKEEFYVKIGMTSASFRGNARKTPLNSTAIENVLSEIPDVNSEWLLTGNGEMLKGQSVSIRGDKNIAASNISGNVVGGSVGGHMVNIAENSDFEKIIKENEIELVRQGAASYEAQRIIDALKIEIESLKRELQSKDNIIESLIKALSNKGE